jgi:hypothetical protein
MDVVPVVGASAGEGRHGAIDPLRQGACRLGPVRASARQPAIASAENHTGGLPRTRRPASYSAQLVTRCRCPGMW